MGYGVVRNVWLHYYNSVTVDCTGGPLIAGDAQCLLTLEIFRKLASTDDIFCRTPIVMLTSIGDFGMAAFIPP